MLREKAKLTRRLTEATAPNDSGIRISIAGLAYCQLTPAKSRINFLSNVPHHKLDLTIYQSRRDSAAPSLLLNTRVEVNHTISIQADTSVAPRQIAVDGNFPLSEIINISQLHSKNKIIKYRKDVPADSIPIKLTVHDCGFYTQLMTRDNFEIIEVEDDRETGVVDKRKIGFAMGGKIECGAGGSLKIQVKGSNSLSLVRPLKDAEGDFIYDIVLNNHCVDLQKCEAELGGDGDFKYYYDLLEDPDKPSRKFKLKKALKTGATPLGTDVAACNVVITEPPLPLNP